MKFSDFTVKRLLSSGDYLVGYDEDGNNIRISKSDLASALASSVQAQSVQVQYSSNGNTWHAAYASGDRHMRIKAGSGAWSSAISIAVSAYDIWLSEGNTGTESDFLESLKGEDGAGVEAQDLDITQLAGYDTLLSNISSAMANEKSSILSQLRGELSDELETQYANIQMSSIEETKSLAENDYLTVVTDGGLRKVKISSLAANVGNSLSTSKIVSGGSGKPLTLSFDVPVSAWKAGESGYKAEVRVPGVTEDAAFMASAAPESMGIWADSPFHVSEVLRDTVVVVCDEVPDSKVTINMFYWK